MKQEFEMLQQEMDDIIAINKNMPPVMKIGNYISGMDLAEKVNAYWEGLGNKYGFKHMTVEGSAKGKLFFLAEPKPIVVPKTEKEKQIDKYIANCEGYVSSQIKESIRKIVSQLESCEYENEVGMLINNIAFLALKQLSI